MIERRASPSAQGSLKEWRGKDEDIFVCPVQIKNMFQQEESRSPPRPGALVNAYQKVVASTTILTVPGHLPSFVNVESTSIGVASPPSSRPELVLSCSSSFISSNSHGGEADCRGNVPEAAMID